MSSLRPQTEAALESTTLMPSPRQRLYRPFRGRREQSTNIGDGWVFRYSNAESMHASNDPSSFPYSHNFPSHWIFPPHSWRTPTILTQRLCSRSSIGDCCSTTLTSAAEVVAEPCRPFGAAKTTTEQCAFDRLKAKSYSKDHETNRSGKFKTYSTRGQWIRIRRFYLRNLFGTAVSTIIWYGIYIEK